MSTRVEIPIWTDRWMMGDRCGDVVKIVRRKLKGDAEPVEIAYVKLDISGKTVKVIYTDCRVVND